MAIFGVLELEATVQENDKTRLSALKSYVSKDEAAITLVEIEPESGAGYIDVTGSDSEDWYLDYQYTTEESKTVSLRITTDGAPSTSSATISVVTAATDDLWSSDQDLINHEPNILEYVRPGRNSFLDFHRTAQTRILAYLDEKKIWDEDGNRLTKADITDTQEFAEWSKFEVLLMIFESFHNATDDVFQQKAEEYRKLRNGARNRAALRLDRNNDGTTDTAKVEMVSVGYIRR